MFSDRKQIVYISYYEISYPQALLLYHL